MNVPMRGTSLRLDPARRGDELLIYAAGELDLASAPALEAMLLAARADDTPSVVTVDAADLTFVDAAGLGVLARCWSQLSEHGCRLRLRNTRSYLHELLVLTDLARLLEVPDTAAIAAETLRLTGPEPPTTQHP